MTDPKDILFQYWKFSNFRGLQKEVIEACLDGHDCCVFFPTGGGKSLCFQVPALAREGICIVISPLISLMQDQVQNLKLKGIKAIHLKGGLSYKETDRIFDNIANANYKFLYLSPEKLQSQVLLERLKYLNISLIAIDEAHCISHWGHDFRPAFLDIFKLRDLHPEVPIMALTATATHRVREDIQNQLQLKNPKVFKSSFKRPNIAIKILQTDNKWRELIHQVNKAKASVIVYVRSRKATLELTKLLHQNQITANAFHGGLSNLDRQLILEQWLGNKVKVVVATSAFGMGIDKPDVDLVFHMHLPESLESYYQEIGRAGRDGNPAKAVLVYNSTDTQRLSHQFLKVIPTVKDVKKVYKHLMSYLQIAYGEGDSEEFGIDLNTFCSRYNLPLRKSFEVLKLLDKLSILSFNQQYQINARIQVVVSHKVLLNYLRQNQSFKDLMTLILRTYGGIFDLFTSINLNFISNKTGFSQKKIKNDLMALESQGIISLKLTQQDLILRFLMPREDDKTINSQKKFINSYRDQKVKQIDAVCDFVQNKNQCFQMQLLEYFGDEENKMECGICSVCDAQNIQLTTKANRKDLTILILNELKKGPKTPDDLIKAINAEKTQVILVLKHLLETNKIEIQPNNFYKLLK
ncbi:RecQ family ATP-dependent DNA helicase [Mesohalobacter halotolerans]|uniref:ATP-dependent DNA helicase RecQ n=1 Tax=Mesohalobacter halotolerans TaxID=1883405 RepID=A0A4U5TRR3_9FLAO|nr:ATP-dependent DNA helicase RecQ [Mesohalobacter halotolerans]MBS3738377.1 RecQ family ATP-dependent DNA helicase [Psychroflexus sp.]TKS56084.1 RecQ family ATP-dependent DNA helicase [Mesohalobacter halotolerans]